MLPVVIVCVCCASVLLALWIGRVLRRSSMTEPCPLAIHQLDQFFAAVRDICKERGFVSSDIEVTSHSSGRLMFDLVVQTQGGHLTPINKSMASEIFDEALERVGFDWRFKLLN